MKARSLLQPICWLRKHVHRWDVDSTDMNCRRCGQHLDEQVPALVAFAEQTVVIAKDQPEYRPMPAYRYENDNCGRIVFCWKLCLIDRLKVLFTGVVWQQQMTFNGPIQPALLLVDKPSMPMHGGAQ
jgi:hypothetical protein